MIAKLLESNLCTGHENIFSNFDTEYSSGNSIQIQRKLMSSVNITSNNVN